MVFEISHVINNNQWGGAIEDGINRVYKKNRKIKLTFHLLLK